MSDDKTHQEVKLDQPKARKILGREEMFDVFKTGGEAELFARPAQNKHRVETETRTGPSSQRQITDAIGPSINKTEITDADGPSINHQMSDGVGPIIKKSEIPDADGPTINHQMSDGVGPIIKKTEIADADGPTIAHQMSDGVGPIIKKTQIADADGPTIAHQMIDANGPEIKRFLENTIVKLPTIPNSLASITKTDVQSSRHQPENSSGTEPAHRVDTFSVHMAERIAKMKSEQKETKAKMDELEANTHEIQEKLTPKGKK